MKYTPKWSSFLNVFGNQITIGHKTDQFVLITRNQRGCFHRRLTYWPKPMTGFRPSESAPILHHLLLTFWLLPSWTWHDIQAVTVQIAWGADCATPGPRFGIRHFLDRCLVEVNGKRTPGLLALWDAVRDVWAGQCQAVGRHFVWCSSRSSHYFLCMFTVSKTNESRIYSKVVPGEKTTLIDWMVEFSYLDLHASCLPVTVMVFLSTNNLGRMVCERITDR